MATRKNNQYDGKNFTMLFDDFPEELKDSIAWTYAVINRHCLMREGICRASQSTMAKEARITRGKFRRAQNYLIQNGYVIDRTPDKKASCHTLEINQWKADSNQTDDDDPWPEDDE
jgi:hypothetical protein